MGVFTRGAASDAAFGGGGDPYHKLKGLQQQLEFMSIKEDYIKDEMKNLKREMIRAREEVKRVQSVPLIIGTFAELVDQTVAYIVARARARSNAIRDAR